MYILYVYKRIIHVNFSIYFFKASAVSTLEIIGSKLSSSSSDDKIKTDESCGDTEFVELEGTSIGLIGVIIGLSGAITAEVPNSNNKLIIK